MEKNRALNALGSSVIFSEFGFTGHTRLNVNWPGFNSSCVPSRAYSIQLSAEPPTSAAQILRRDELGNSDMSNTEVFHFPAARWLQGGRRTPPTSRSRGRLSSLNKQYPGSKETNEENAPAEFRFHPKVCYCQSLECTIQDYQGDIIVWTSSSTGPGDILNITATDATGADNWLLKSTSDPDVNRQIEGSMLILHGLVESVINLHRYDPMEAMKAAMSEVKAMDITMLKKENESSSSAWMPLTGHPGARCLP
ncbi:hypothetical protein FACUT_13255 [Fusarium acutatum]|uniref:Uncharacterized protein n=1 Tax=Fusarium acutatum TaxID=78861 RepID=A0A8H4JDN8_9HYPO|nr:hypothetical protein FACUT_13255 [Fusarium acutatum]